LPRTGRLTDSLEIGAETTRAQALVWLARTFDRAGVEEPKREARLALCEAASLTAAALISTPEEPLGEPAAKRLAKLASRRAAGEPLSKIAGRREFWGLTLIVSPDVLDPRPETETLVEAALKLIGSRRGERLRILDLGVGSGAILCALLTECPAARGVGVDVSPAAVAVARRNLSACGVAERAEVRLGSWAEGVEGPFDLIVSNPPYVPSADIEGLAREVRDFDPRLALDGGADGLDAYRAILPASAGLLAPGGRLIVEVGVGQGGNVLGLAARLGFVHAETRRDLAGIERVVIGELPASL
jgi:release factor glutamine methyltransferase